MNTPRLYRGYEITPMCSADEPYVAAFKIVPPFGGEPVFGSCPEAYTTQELAYEAAFSNAQARIDELLAD